MSPFDVPEQDTVSTLIGRAQRAISNIGHQLPTEAASTVGIAQVHATCALARAIENGFGDIADIGDALKTVAVEVGSVAQAVDAK